MMDLIHSDEHALRDRAIRLIDELAPLTRRDEWWLTNGPAEIIEKHLETKDRESK